MPHPAIRKEFGRAGSRPLTATTIQQRDDVDRPLVAHAVEDVTREAFAGRFVGQDPKRLGVGGAQLLFAANFATLFRHNEQSSGITMLAMLPIAAWELSVGTWMLVKGFKPSPVTANLTKVD